MITKDYLEKYGITPPEGKDEVDVDTFCQLYKAKVQELTLQDKDVIEPLKQQAKKEGEIIATKRAFKAIKSKFGIDLSNADLESKSLDEIVAIAAEASTAKTTADVKELQDKLIAAANKAHEWEETFNSKVSEIEKSYSQKYAAKEFEKQILAIAATEKLIIPTEKALKLLTTEIKDNGYFIQMGTEGITITKDEAGQYPVLQDDGMGRASIKYLFDKFLSDFKVKNNGNGDSMQGGGRTGGQPVKVSEHMQALMRATVKR